MKTVLVTGHRGFLGTNLRIALARRGDVRVIGLASGRSTDELASAVEQADFIFHLAGVNRPRNDADFAKHNTELTQQVCHLLKSAGRQVPIVFSSSIQAELDNPYGRSKRAAETALVDLACNTGAPVYIDRLPNVYGKWSRPDYNSVVATFCHNISHDLPVRVDDPSQSVRLAHVDDVVRRWIDLLDGGGEWPQVGRENEPIDEITVGDLRDRITSFRDSRFSGLLPDLADRLTRSLYGTYLSFVDADALALPVALRKDPRGWLFELVKSQSAGQIFVSSTRPGFRRGDHYHDTKVEKFCVVQGRGLIRIRPVGSDAIVEYRVDDDGIRIVDIPPGLTHSIENTGTSDMITIFWASEIFDPDLPDTFPAVVVPEN